MWSILQFQPKPPPPPAETRRHELTGTDKLLWPVTSAQTSYHLTSPNRPLMSASCPDCLTRCGGSSQRVFTLWNTKREGDAFAVQRQCKGDWHRSTQDLSALTLRQGLTHQCPPLQNVAYSNYRCLYLDSWDIDRSGGCVLLSRYPRPHRNMKQLSFCYQNWSSAGLRVRVPQWWVA